MANNQVLKAWVSAARLRTLPLALASILLGSLLAASAGAFNVLVFLFSILTATIYQVLSNYANDLGDGLKGTDANRVGEKRAVASGTITIEAMKKAVFLFTVLALLSGTGLSWLAMSNLSVQHFLFFTALGIFATWAARSYTMGKHAYGYAGLGDVFVFLFFGCVGVLGAFYLHTNTFDWVYLLPASAVGFLATGVLNLNNLRDLETDKEAGKITLVVRMGRQGAKVYQAILLFGALFMQVLFVYLMHLSTWGYLFLIVAPLILLNLINTFKAKSAKDYDPLLKPLAISTLLFCLISGVGANL
jgi:1,4-dihydroxy-2-naphthoate octaprenyltransferase